jgi:hypothetical protein
MTNRALGKVDEATRRRSPLHKQRVEDAPTIKPANPEVRAIAPRAAAGTAQPLTPEQQMEYEEYLRRKFALEQGA